MAKRRFSLAICGALSATYPAPACQAREPAPVSGAAALAFRIGAGSLDETLKALAVRGHMQLLYDPALVEGRHSDGFNGTLAPAQALDQLLRGTGLRAVAVSANAFVLERLPSPQRRPDRVVLRRPLAAGSAQVPVDMGTVHVTGTRIPRAGLDEVTPSPLTLINRADIEASGQQTLFELLRFQPGMVGHHPVEVAADGRAGSQQPFASAATTSLNALGPRATLFLIDGHRIANYGLISANLGGLTDLESIPLSFVERIEIIRGGASAIYGADAMAGVVNIVLRKHQEGGEVVARYGVSDQGDAQQRQLSASLGSATRGGGNIFLGLDYFDREGLIGAQRRWRTLDQRSHGLGDYRYQLGYRDDEGNLVKSFCPALGESTRANCVFDPPAFLTLQPAVERLSLYAYVNQPLGETAQWHADMRVSRTRQRLRSAPFHALVELPAGHPDTIDGASEIGYAFFDVGPIRNASQIRTLDLSGGMQGWLGDWQWSATASHHTNAVTNVTEGLVRDTAIISAVGDYSYRFGALDNSPAVLAAISPPITARGDAVLDQLTAGIDGPWFTMPAGQAKVAAGVEFARDGLHHRPDALMVEHDVALGPQKERIDQHRYSQALYTELSLPLARRLHADLALRMDRRQGYGSKVSPKLGLKWNVTDTLTLRGTVATGYRAPSLFELRRPTVVDETVFVIETPELVPCRSRYVATPDITVCLLSRSASDNPQLRPETSRSQTLGLVWAPTSTFSLSLDHFRIDRRNEIVPGSAFDSLAAFPRSLRRDESGLLFAVDDYFENVGRTDVRGWELDAQYRVDTDRLGRYAVRLSGNRFDRITRTLLPGTPALDYAGYGAPAHSVLASLQWGYADWLITLAARNLGASRVGVPGEPCPRVNVKIGHCVTPGSTIVDVNLAYSGIPQWRLALNVRDLGDHEPVNYDIDNAGYDIANDDPRGRYYLVSAAYRF